MARGKQPHRSKRGIVRARSPPPFLYLYRGAPTRKIVDSFDKHEPEHPVVLVDRQALRMEPHGIIRREESAHQERVMLNVGICHLRNSLTTSEAVTPAPLKVSNLPRTGDNVDASSCTCSHLELGSTGEDGDSSRGMHYPASTNTHCRLKPSAK